LEPPAADARALGEQRITDQVELGSRRLHRQDRQDLFQEVHTALCGELGEDYREQTGALETTSEFRETTEYRALVRCVDRVCKRMKRSKRHMSLDQLKEDHNYVPDDPKSIRGRAIIKLTTLLAIQLDELGETERLMLELLQAKVPYEEIAHRLGMGRTKFFETKRAVFDKLAAQLMDDT
jgi:hypothetical protein